MSPKLKIRGFGLGLGMAFLCCHAWANSDLPTQEMDSIRVQGDWELAIPSNRTDQSLDDKNFVNMIQRGAWAWEPVHQGKNGLDIQTRIDGVPLLGACTDHMDPPLQYAEIAQLAKISIASIGSRSELELQTQVPHLDSSQNHGALMGGASYGQNDKWLSGRWSWSQPTWAGIFTSTWRGANDYLSPTGQSVPFSAYGKGNLSAALVQKIDDHNQWSTQWIVDRSGYEGFPQLTMDVGSAQALMGLLKWTKDQNFVQIYGTQVDHQMDDHHRPWTGMEMIMPGQSQTMGLWFHGSGEAPLDLRYEFWRQNASMTMLIDSQTPMFLSTWPDLQSQHLDLGQQYHWMLGSQVHLQLQWQNSLIDSWIGDPLGVRELTLFNSQVSREAWDDETQVQGLLLFQHGDWQQSLEVQIFRNAPSPEQRWAYYLYNRRENADYVGGRDLPAIPGGEIHLSNGCAGDHWQWQWELWGRAQSQWIGGKILDSLSSVTPGTSLKQWTALGSGTWSGMASKLDWNPWSWWQSTWRSQYSQGYLWQIHGDAPFNSPWQNDVEQRWTWRSWIWQTHMRLWAPQAAQRLWGEQAQVWDANWQTHLAWQGQIGSVRTRMQIGVDNILNENHPQVWNWTSAPSVGRSWSVGFSAEY